MARTPDVFQRMVDRYSWNAFDSEVIGSEYAVKLLRRYHERVRRMVNHHIDFYNSIAQLAIKDGRHSQEAEWKRDACFKLLNDLDRLKKGTR